MTISEIVFGRMVKKKRNDANMSQDDLGKLIGLSRVSVANFESANQTVSLHHALKIAKTLEFSLKEIEDELKKGSLDASLKALPEVRRLEIEKVLKETRT